MAVVAGSNIKCFGFTTPSGPVTMASGVPVKCCYVSCDFTGTYAQADNANIAAVGGATGAIATALRNGKTITLLDAAFAQPGTQGSDVALGAKTVAVSSAAITCELTTNDMSTEFADATAIGTAGNPVVFFVSFKET